MKTLLVAATHAELSGVFRHFDLPEHSFTSGPSFDMLITGVGMTATAFTLGRYLKQDYKFVLNLGIAGSFDPNLPLGTLVNVVEDRFAELGAEDQGNFLSIEQLGLGESIFYANHAVYKYQLAGFKEVRGITVNKVHGRDTSIADIRTQLSPDVESMEGAAVFYCCKQLDLPVVQLRSISNYVEPRNKENWQIGQAIKNLNDWVIGFLTNP